MTKKRIILNAFDMTCVSHQAAGTWRHPESQASRYNDIEYWTNMAIELERGHFDTLFIATWLACTTSTATLPARR
ncbi:Dimethyl-sulfide monooxygenase [Methyloligella halotolerans]|uniref:Dimethyl-sulfide monooxygenase n=1 Tax=Methyloligella halotolerans TaxID=1177755 RepID=A0A1E2RY50_9HYPH|nr:hypothetical protein [Methyloligella halotolerans]ODA67028.1 Dimethyl-sulfide monooxygenase [Methyloligella halotolerans]